MPKFDLFLALLSAFKSIEALNSLVIYALIVHLNWAAFQDLTYFLFPYVAVSDNKFNVIDSMK